MRRLLIAIRSRALADMLTQDLSSRFEVHYCGTGTGVSDLIEGLRPDALVMDLRLPKRTGFAVPESCSRKPPVIIALSEFIDDDIIRRAMAAGIAALILTPCTARCIVEYLDRLTVKTPSPEM